MNRKDLGKIVTGGLTVLGLCLASGCNTTGNNTRILQPRQGVSDPYASKQFDPKDKKDVPKAIDRTEDFKFEEIKQSEPLVAKHQPPPVIEQPFVFDPVDPKLEITPPVEPDLQTYTVAKGDTLWGIAGRAKVSVDELASVNGLDKKAVLPAGKTLKIPRGGVIPEGKLVEKTPKVGSYYTVKRGDTLSGIAKRYKMSIKELKAMNSLKSDRIVVGQKLALKEGVKIDQPTKLTASVPTDGIHVVQSGDSLWKIAQMYGMSVNSLKAANGITSSTLQIGQKLKVSGNAKSIKTSVTPKSAPAQTAVVNAGGEYTVQSGDSLWSIAKKHNVSVSELKKANNKSGANLDVGEKLIIPGVDGAKTQGTVAKANGPKVEGPKKAGPTSRPKVMLPHFVEEGNETLKSIAEMYDSRVEWIIDANPGIKSDADLKRVKEIQVPVVEIQLQGG